MATIVSYISRSWLEFETNFPREAFHCALRTEYLTFYLINIVFEHNSMEAASEDGYRRRVLVQYNGMDKLKAVKEIEGIFADDPFDCIEIMADKKLLVTFKNQSYASKILERQKIDLGENSYLTIGTPDTVHVIVRKLPPYLPNQIIKRFLAKFGEVCGIREVFHKFGDDPDGDHIGSCDLSVNISLERHIPVHITVGIDPGFVHYIGQPLNCERCSDLAKLAEGFRNELNYRISQKVKNDGKVSRHKNFHSEEDEKLLDVKPFYVSLMTLDIPNKLAAVLKYFSSVHTGGDTLDSVDIVSAVQQYICDLEPTSTCYIDLILFFDEHENCEEFRWGTEEIEIFCKFC